MAAMPEPWKSLKAFCERLAERVRALENRSALFNTGLEQVDPGQLMQSGSITIPNNGLLLVDGGDVILLNDDLEEILRVGRMEFSDSGVIVRREDGSIAWEMRKPFSAGDATQAFLIRDRQGSVISGDSLLSPIGFDAPHLSMPFIPVDYTSGVPAQTTSSTTFVALHEYRGFRQNPALKPQLMVKCSDGSTSAEVQFYDVLGAVYLGGFLGTPAVQTITVPLGTTAFTLFELPSSALQLPGLMSAPLHLQIHVRRTAGAGSVSVAPVRTIGSGF